MDAKTKRRKQLREQLQEYKKTVICEQCGHNDYRVLEFHHHKDDKKANITKLTCHGYSWHTIQAEINKCQVLCANCHRIVHTNV